MTIFSLPIYQQKSQLFNEMARVSQLPEKFLLLIESEFEKTSKQHLFEELAESLLKSNPELGDRPDVLFKAVSALFQEAPGTKENDREHSVGYLH